MSTPSATTTDESSPEPRAATKSWIRRLGVFGFLFFFIKGLAWLVIPAVAATGIFAL